MIKNLLLIIGMLGLVGCGKSFQVDGSIGSGRPFFRESTSSDFIPSNDLVTSNCHAEGEICLFFKNPVFQTKQVISPSDAQALKEAQKFSAHLTGLDQSGFIKNSFFDVKSVDGSHLLMRTALDKKGIDDNLSMALFLNAYYWLNRAHEYFNKNFKDAFHFERPMSVYVDDAFDGWSWTTKSLHLDGEKKSALSADVLLILWGEAQVGFATQGKIYQSSSSHHQQCGGDPVGCCKDTSGCSQAILRGSGDILHAMLFEDAPDVGEFYHQSLSGQMVCGKKRNPDQFSGMTFSEAYSLCPEKSGSTLAMGMAYASMWREIRKSANAHQVDEVFLKLLPQLSGEDTFETAQQKAAVIATNLGYNEVAKKVRRSFW